MTQRDEEFHEFLTDLPKNHSETFPNEVTFVAKAIPKFSSMLGYTESHLFFDVHYGRNRPDIVLAEARSEKPWVLIEAKVSHRPLKSDESAWRRQLYEYMSMINPEYAVLFSPELLILLYNNTETRYHLRTLTKEQSKEIFSLLKKPQHLPRESKPILEFITKKSIETDTFKLDLQEYSQKLQAVLTAKTNNEKKITLEGLAKLLFEGIPFLSCKYPNLRTASSEIDLVIQYNGWDKKTIFDEFGRYVLGECKNWSSPIGAVEIRDFKGKLQKSKVKLGIIFSRNGITGQNKGADARREIHSAFDTDDLYIVVISEEDLRQILQATSLYDILDTKIDELRFDL